MVRVPRRLGPFLGATLVGAALAVTGLLGVPGLGAADAAPSVAAPTAIHHAVTAARYTGYAIDKPACTQPTRPGQFTCMAYRRVDVPKGTPGAHRYSIPTWAHGPDGGYTPAALAEAYGYDPNRKVPAQTVAVVDWNNDPHVRADLNHFDRHYGLRVESSKSFRVVNQNGKAEPLPASTPAVAIEIALDVETVRAVCHNCKILLVEASRASGPSLAAAVDTAVRLGATVVSNSYGVPERPNHPVPASVVRAYKHPGVVITASSGDNGYFFWDLRNGDPFTPSSQLPHSASFPASLPDVVSVGGTTLNLNSDGTRKSETVWDSNGASDAAGNNQAASLGAAGGGCSIRYAAPSWQRLLPGYKAAKCGGKRLSVDVAAIADPATGFSVYDTYAMHGWGVIGGTSLSSPVIAAMWALAGGAHGMSVPAHALYQNHRLRPTTLYDVVDGGNGWCGGAATTDCSVQAAKLGSDNPNWVYDAQVDCSFPRRYNVKKVPAKDPECNAGPGYDGPSGVGTPKGLASFRTTVPTLSISASSPRHPHTRITFTGHVQRVITSSKIVQKIWQWGDRSPEVKSLNPHVGHRYAKAGTYRVRLIARDNLGQSATVVRSIRIH